MPERKFSELPSAANLTGNELAALSQMQSGSLTSVKSTLQAIANWFAVYAQYTTALQTTDKSITGAINELKQLISLIPQFSIEVVQVLPTEDISDTTIYLVPAEDPETGNYYDEYIHVNNTWELVGTTAVDLSDYYTKAQADGKFAVTIANTQSSGATKAKVGDFTQNGVTKSLYADDADKVLRAAFADHTVEGNPVSFDAYLGLEVPSKAEVSFSPIQDLHGYDYPWVGGAGKNKLPFEIAEIIDNNTGGTWSGNIYTYRGITFTPDSEGKWTATGTATDATYIRVGKFKPSSGSYLINGISGGSGTAYRIRYKVGGGSSQNMYNGDSNIITIDGDTEVLFDLYVSANYTADITFEPMIRLSSVADSTFAPYENICPISGRTEVNVYQDTEQTETPETTYTSTFGQTVYGGKVDLVSGKLVVDKAIIDMGTLSWNKGGTGFTTTLSDIKPPKNNATEPNVLLEAHKYIPKSSNADSGVSGSYEFIVSQQKVITYRYPMDGIASGSAFADEMSGDHLCYELATPTEITLTPQEIELLKGQNVLWTDGDNVKLVYSADIKAYIDSKLAQ